MNGVHFPNLTTQIGGAPGASIDPLLALKRRLQGLGITVKYPLDEIPSFSVSGLTPYDMALAYYQAIAAHDFHIIFNERAGTIGYLDSTLALEMLYAMVQHRPIVLLHSPVFQPDVDTFARDTIERHLNRIVIGNLSTLDIVDTVYLLRNVASQPIWYMLSNGDKRIIANHVRAYFRHFFDGAATRGRR